MDEVLGARELAAQAAVRLAQLEDSVTKHDHFIFELSRDRAVKRVISVLISIILEGAIPDLVEIDVQVWLD